MVPNLPKSAVGLPRLRGRALADFVLTTFGYVFTSSDFIKITNILNIMRKFRTMWQYMDDDSRYIPEDNGECIVQPDLDLSVKEIMQRWVRNQPLDNVARNGSFLHEGAADEDLPDEVFESEDIDLMDMVDAEEYLATRNHVAQTSTTGQSAEPKASEAGAAAKPAEPASQQASEGEAVG